ncbi:ribosomal L1 domain-containing protein 1-like [Salvia hispanica]|uniref:ribosomal L1 domain-containing protein 1-like n=1 Tax=Salvia hispanica TaxID=49212 RepID=UPI00200921C2|nr:ribosomal L1 domain-containing protein 1-like [Salvia hispanica]
MSSTTEARAAATPSRVSQSTIEAAVTALLKHKSAQSANEKLQLLPQDDYFYLNLTLRKIPSNPRTNPYRIPLPHPILDAAASEVCLIVDDRPGTTTPPSDQIKKLIKSQSIPISKVIKLSKLKANYKPFEARRKLCNSYDMFLVDKRVVHLLPKLIGKEFFRKKKLPLGVDLGKKNLKVQVERVLGSALLFIGKGTCSVLKVGKMEMEKGGIVENVVEAIKGVIERVPKKWDGVRSLHLKLSDSVALPVYQALPDVRLKIEGLKDVEEGGEVSEVVSDGEGGKKKQKQKRKGRIHEVRYMDVGEDVKSDSDVDMNESEAGEKGTGESGSDDEDEKVKDAELRADEGVGMRRRKKQGVLKDLNETKVGKKGVEVEEASSDDEDKKVKDVEMRTDEGVGKRRRKKEGVAGDSSGKKRVKKSEGVKPKKSGAAAESEGKKKSEVGRKSNSKVKDVKKKKRVSGK